MKTSNIINKNSMLHVYMTAESQITHTLQEVRKLALSMYDRDVLIDLSSVSDLTEEQLIILLTIEVLLREEGHHLILRGIPITVMHTLNTLGLTHVLNFQEMCV